MTVIKGILVRADESVPAELVEFEQRDLKALQGFVGGWIQIVEGTNPDLSFVFNEEGKHEGLPLNRRATLMLWTYNSAFRDQDVLVGDVVIIGPPDERTGETTGVPDELITLLFHTERYRYLVKTHPEGSWNGNGVTYDNWVDAYNGAQSLARRWKLVEEVMVVAA
ncbi:DUF3846 domain-containing protein [Mycolicibacterium porcinum]|uniref:DUF3846 domain-containing protein n=1 Tax=Mycolicibacterium porcinum TaxID=39693 RepID=UPI000848B60F|nr:DUF3846 domain-containing protein [Mycolicibacterium porcinum]ODR25790.1 hypothetical protein BHQ19_10180 [Mycolicibacterium porcinum]